ncbi:MAG: RluA family pseudouridine synthase [Clostridium sp.]|nr:RluA family pseudouridine synthase [Clostridium sp.]
MKRVITYEITNENMTPTAGSFLSDHGISHRILVRLKQTENGICLNGIPARTNTPLTVGDLLTISLSDESSSEHIPPWKHPLEILYEDEDLIVINKEAGIPVHPSQGHYGTTLANALAGYFASRGEEFVFRAVSRLDKDTSGVILIAKHMLSGAILSSMVADRRIHRTYTAIVSGRTEEEGTITLPIARKNASVIERCVDSEHGEYACTHYRRLAYDPDTDCSQLLLSLETGRTHQIRVHMKAIGHPLPGDFLYHPDFRYIGRQALHSWHLSFLHPITGKSMEFTAPLPQDFRFFGPLQEEYEAVRTDYLLSPLG